MAENSIKWQIDRFDDIKVLQFRVPSFEELSLRQKSLIYFLSQAALWGRDILADQNFKHNLQIRSLLESIVTSYQGDRENTDFVELEKYLKKVWFANGIHHHYSGDKFKAAFSPLFFSEQALAVGCTANDVELISAIIFHVDLYPTRCNHNDTDDMITSSANNYYDGVTQIEVEAYYKEMANRGDKARPISYGLNSRLVKEIGEIKELTYKIGGLYSEEIEKIVYFLEKAIPYSENKKQKESIIALVEYYKSGDLAIFDKYSTLWVQDIESQVDFINGFIEVYGDPLGYKGSWEASVNFKDFEATRRTDIISSNAQWFEDNSPIDDIYKKREVKGVTAKVITVATIAGDCYPATPIGINLPNSDWIRKEYGSKSVTIQNITAAYNAASLGSGFAEEFTLSKESLAIAKEYGLLAGDLHTDLHECLGHGSGQLAEGVVGDELKNHGSTLEEARADLFALYYMGDEKIVEIGIAPNMNIMKAAYDNFIFNGLIGQLTRVERGKTIVEAHMRDRQLIAAWCYEKGKENNVISFEKNNGKSYVVVNDYLALKELFGELLREIQRIKSSGDFEAGKTLVENYGVKVDDTLHAEVLERYAKLDLAPYSGFVNPNYIATFKDDEITDVKIEYCNDFAAQMFYYSNNYSITNR